MPRFDTKYYGQLECTEEDIFDFRLGLPGFERETQFVFIERPDRAPLVFMQSLHRADVCFLALPVFVADREYRLSMASEDLSELDLDASREPKIGPDVLCLTLLTLVEGSDPTVNLRAPIVVNLRNRKGMQSIQMESSYSFHAPLLPQTECQPCS